MYPFAVTLKSVPRVVPDVETDGLSHEEQRIDNESRSENVRHVAHEARIGCKQRKSKECSAYCGQRIGRRKQPRHFMREPVVAGRRVRIASGEAPSHALDVETEHRHCEHEGSEHEMQLRGRPNHHSAVDPCGLGIGRG